MCASCECKLIQVIAVYMINLSHVICILLNKSLLPLFLRSPLLPLVVKTNTGGFGSPERPFGAFTPEFLCAHQESVDRKLWINGHIIREKTLNSHIFQFRSHEASELVMNSLSASCECEPSGLGVRETQISFPQHFKHGFGSEFFTPLSLTHSIGYRS